MVICGFGPINYALEINFGIIGRMIGITWTHTRQLYILVLDQLLYPNDNLNLVLKMLILQKMYSTLQFMHGTIAWK